MKRRKAGFPMLHVVGDVDDVVPFSENTPLFEQKIRKEQVIHKPGVGLHPHSLQNPQPIVDFVFTGNGLPDFKEEDSSLIITLIEVTKSGTNYSTGSRAVCFCKFNSWTKNNFIATFAVKELMKLVLQMLLIWVFIYFCTLNFLKIFNQIKF
ncbi:MAG: hypothetical protein M0R39_15740 [Prolixibacteraceae bacterium]|nr:hypothetical protein [Prolixibacteraceae bacterium]